MTQNNERSIVNEGNVSSALTLRLNAMILSIAAMPCAATILFTTRAATVSTSASPASSSPSSRPSAGSRL